jgi:hypothetical protein
MTSPINGSALNAASIAHMRDSIAMAGLSPQLMIAGLQLITANNAVIKKMDDIKSTQEQIEAYRKQAAYISAMQAQIGGQDWGDVTGNPEKMDFGPGGVPIDQGSIDKGNGTTVDRGAFQVGWQVCTATPDADGVPQPITVKPGDPGYASHNQFNYSANGMADNDQWANKYVYLDKGLSNNPAEAQKQAAAYGGVAVAVYHVNSQALKSESERLSSKMEDLNTQLNIQQTELERLTKLSEEIVAAGKRSEELKRDTDQKLQGR